MFLEPLLQEKHYLLEIFCAENTYCNPVFHVIVFRKTHYIQSSLWLTRHDSTCYEHDFQVTLVTNYGYLKTVLSCHWCDYRKKQKQHEKGNVEDERSYKLYGDHETIKGESCNERYIILLSCLNTFLRQNKTVKKKYDLKGISKRMLIRHDKERVFPCLRILYWNDIELFIYKNAMQKMENETRK